MGKRSESTSLQRRFTNGQQEHETMLTIISHQGNNTNPNPNGNANPNHFPPLGRLSSQSQTITRVSEAVANSEPSDITGGVAIVQLPWKTVWQLLKKWNMDFTYDLVIPLLGGLKPKRNENTCPHQVSYMNVHSSTMRDGQKVETTKIFVINST